MRAFAIIAALASTASADPPLNIHDTAFRSPCRVNHVLRECVSPSWIPMLGDYTVMSREWFYNRVGRPDITRAVRRRHMLGAAITFVGVAGSLFGLYAATSGHPGIGVPVMCGSWIGGVWPGVILYIDDSDGVTANQARHMIEVAHF